MEKRSSGIEHRVLSVSVERGEDVPVPYGKSHPFTETLLGQRVKCAALAEIHHSLFSVSVSCNTFLKVYFACAENAVGF